MAIVGILQPGYLPWAGFFEQLHRCDVFVLYDDVQYDKNGWRNRNRIKTPDGPQWLTVPVFLKYRDLVKDVRIDNKTNWRRKHLTALRQSYAKSPYMKDYLPIFEEGYGRDWDFLVDLDLFFIEKLAAAFGITGRRILRSSELGLSGDRLMRLINICKVCGGDTFYEGAAGANYIDCAFFARQGVRVVFQNYRHPIYKQPYGEFVPYMSAVDMLFNCGPESLATLISGADKGPDEEHA
jgi:hypothetical protein